MSVNDRRATELIRARLNVEKAEREYYRAVEAFFEIGKPVMWTHGDNKVCGVVVRVSPTAERVEVESDLSGACYWVSVYRIMEAMGLPYFASDVKTRTP